MIAATALGRVAVGVAAGGAGAWRVALGGGPAIATPGTGGPGVPGVPIVPAGPDISALLLLAAAVFAVIGFARAMARELPTLAVVGIAYWLVGQQWAFLARWSNHFYRLFVFAVVKRGILADDPTTAWAAVSDMSAPVPTEGSAVLWQIMYFVAIVLLVGYGASGLLWRSPAAGLLALQLPVLVGRVLGAMAGAGSGALMALFILARILPGAHATLIAPGTAARSLIGQFGPVAFVVAVGAIILFGVLSLGGRSRAKEYG